MKVRKRDILLAAGLSLGALLYLLRGDDIEDLLHAIGSANPIWLLGVVGLMILYWFLESGVLHLAIERFNPGQRFATSVRTSMIGQLFNCITPFASGGQPIQAYHLVKHGVPLGAASCALIVKFVVYQSVLILYSIVTLLLRFGLFSANVRGLGLLVLIGFGVNAAVILGLLAICLFRGGTDRFLTACIRRLARWHLLHDETAALNHLRNELDDFYSGFSAISHNKPLIVHMAALTAVQLTAFFLIPWMLYQSFALAPVSPFSMVSAGAFVLNLTSFVPLPGAAGGAELGFHALFSMFFPSSLLNTSVLLWRAVTFYLPIMAGLLFMIDIPRRAPATPRLRQNDTAP